MRLDRITFRILKRKLLAWLRLKFRGKPVVVPKIHIPTRVWGDADERREEALYLAAPSAFWLRPDRDDHDMPCWQIEGKYTPKTVGQNTSTSYRPKVYYGSDSVHPNYQNAVQIQLGNLQQQVLSQNQLGLLSQGNNAQGMMPANALLGRYSAY